mgnify:CR=1 FL=1
MELTVAFLLVAIFFFLVLFPTFVFFSYTFLILLPLVLFFWLYVNYFHGILPIDLVATLILLSVLLILFPFLLFQIIAVVLGLLIIERLKNQQNHAFLLTKSANETFGQRLITYRKIFIFFFLAYRKRIFNYIAHQWPFFISMLALIMTIFFLNTLKMIDEKTPSKVAKIYQ